MKYLYLAILFSILSMPSFAYTIKIVGNKKTETKKIEEILLLDHSKSLDIQELRRIEQRLLRTGLFVDAKASFKNDELKVEVQDRWTLIPILKFASGGGITQTTIGTYEANLFGKVKEVGGQYERLGGTNSGVLWFKDPLLFNNKTGIDVQLWKTNRLRTKYNQDMASPKVENGFLHVRERLFLGINRIINDEFRFSTTYEYHNDSFSNKLVPVEAKSKKNIINLPPDTKFHFLGLNAEYGLVRQNLFLLDGSLFNASLLYAFSSNDVASDFSQADFSWKYYKSFGSHTFAQRIMMGLTNTESLQYWNYLGGLDRIRGFADNRFAGRYYWLSNSEMRFTLIEKSNFVIQGSSFLDLVSTAEFFNDLGALTASSTGAGLRVILPKIYRFVFRVDFAKPLKKSDENAISFGVQQFF